jgi:hypothetical protein
MSTYPSPDPWRGRDHQTVQRRSRKGVSTFKRVAIGAAAVTGSLEQGIWNGHDDGLTDDAANARIVAARLLQGVRPMVCGLSAIDIERVTDVAYGSYLASAEVAQLDRLLGTDPTSYEQMVNADIVDRSSVAYQRSYLSGPYRDLIIDSFAAPASVYRSYTAKLKRWPSRQTSGVQGRKDPRQVFALPIGSHRATDRRDSRVFVVAPDGEITQTHYLIAPADDIGADGEPTTRFHGHQLYRRPRPADERKRADKVKLERRTIGTFDEPSNDQAWTELLAALNRDERLKVRCTDGVAIITRDKSGRYASSGARGKWQSRTIATMVDRLASV